MIRIFIDANVLLRFYDSNRREYKKLISTIDEFGSHFFVTKQVADEVVRNRLSVAVCAARGIAEKLQGVNKISLPEHFEIPDGTAIISAGDWNTKLAAFRKQHEDLLNDLRSYYSGLLKAISEGMDNVSRTLDKLFKTAAESTPSQRAEAIERKRFGNPPGKKTDPVGDQLSWVLIRDSLSEGDELWVVTHDTDFYVEFDGKRFFNALLRKELADKFAVPPSISIISDLGAAIRQLQCRMDKKVVPDDTLDKVEQEDAKLPQQTYYGATSLECPKCRGVIDHAIPRPSQYGGWSYWNVCSGCGYAMDSGEPYDE